VATTKTPNPRRVGTRYGKNIRRSKASQERLDAILGAIGNDQEGLRKLLAAIAEIAPAAIPINS
jgi:hypothetical protein